MDLCFTEDKSVKICHKLNILFANAQHTHGKIHKFYTLKICAYISCYTKMVAKIFRVVLYI